MFIRKWKVVERNKRKLGDSQKRGTKNRQEQSIGIYQHSRIKTIIYSTEINKKEEREAVEDILN